jgi:hypothetical protein
MSSDLLEFNLPNNAYAAFDAESLNQLIRERLNDGGIFTDQNYEGSNISQISQIIAYSYHVLLYYLNRTSNENKFTEAQIYENINRIVKLLNYNPKGFQTSILNFEATSTLNSGTYIIPRYSFFNSDGVVYSFIEDASFIKEKNGTELLTNFSNNYSLYQGKFRKYSDYYAIGEDYETMELVVDGKKIDDVGIDVYIKDSVTKVWKEWTRVNDLFLYNSSDTVYQIRYNEKGNYEIKFGNGIHGKKLKTGELISVYYLESNGSDGEVSSKFLDNTSLTVFSEPNLDAILSDMSENVPYLSITQSSSVNFVNTYPSTKVSEGEDVEEIRENAPIKFRSQDRLITALDYEGFIKNNFSGLISDVGVVDNGQFINSHIKYLSDIGITEPYKESRVLENNYLFSDASFLNNVYVYVVPRFDQKFSTTQRFYFITPSQKALMKRELDKYKSVAAEIVFMDPVFMAFDLAFPKSGESPTLEDIDDTKIYIVRDDLSKDKGYLKDKFVSVFVNYFKPSNFSLGQEINLTELKESVLNVVGIKSVYMTNGTNRFNGLNTYVWNPVYRNDLTSSSQNYQLQNFQYSFLWDSDSLKNRIVVIDE